MKKLRNRMESILVWAVGLMSLSNMSVFGEENLPVYLRDRGTGIRTSLFASYIRDGEFLVYPFYEYYRDNSDEGKYRASEGLLFLGYGITDWLAIEFEAAVISASLEPSSGSSVQTGAGVEGSSAESSEETEAAVEESSNDKLKESGLGDVEAQIRVRLIEENERFPEIFSFFEAVAPTQKNKELIGTPDWEFKLGVGLTKGFSWGTLTVRGAVDYSREEDKYQLGEVAVEYLKRLSPSWRVGLGIEGNADDAEIILEVQWHFTNSHYVKFNNSFGIRGQATDWAPEIGIMFSF